MELYMVRQKTKSNITFPYREIFLSILNILATFEIYSYTSNVSIFYNFGFVSLFHACVEYYLTSKKIRIGKIAHYPIVSALCRGFVEGGTFFLFADIIGIFSSLSLLTMFYLTYSVSQKNTELYSIRHITNYTTFGFISVSSLFFFIGLWLNYNYFMNVFIRLSIISISWNFFAYFTGFRFLINGKGVKLVPWQQLTILSLDAVFEIALLYVCFMVVSYSVQTYIN